MGFGCAAALHRKNYGLLVLRAETDIMKEIHIVLVY